MEEIRPFSHRRTSQKVFELLVADDMAGRRIVDVGAGEGYFVSVLGEHLRRKGLTPANALRACDLFPEQFRYGDVPCDRIDANGVLPYEDDSFDAASCIEVVEHIENQFHLVRELFRIVKPGGKVIVTTPNVLNINSRLGFFHSGFGLLFYPLPLGSDEPIHSGGHIHPVSFYYLAHIFHRCGFRRVNLHFDRTKRSAAALTVLLWPPIMAGNFFFRMRMRRKKKEVYRQNRELLRQVNSFGMLTSRTIIVEGVK